MDELVDIFDSDGNFSGKSAMKSEAHKNGWFHQTVHVWFYTADGKVLLQQRAGNKETHPLLWDVSVAGHIGAGEKIEHSALREIEEEIGHVIHRNDLGKIGVFKSVQKHGPSLIDAEFHHTFLCELKVPLENLHKQESEVAALELVPLARFSDELLRMSHTKKYVPHDLEYFNAIIKAIKERL